MATRLVVFAFCLLSFVDCPAYVEAKDPHLAWKQTRELAVPEADQAAAAEGNYVYAIAGSKIAKVDRKSGDRVAVSTGTAKHLNSGFFWQGKLYCAHSNYPQKPDRSDIKVLDPESMQLETYKDFGESDGSLVWLIRRDDVWWCNFAFYGDENAKTYLVRYENDWQPTGHWTYPAEMQRAMGKFSISGGVWHNDDLLVTDHDSRTLYHLRLPAEGTVLTYIGEISAPFTGQGIAADPVTGGLIGINRGKRQLIFATLQTLQADASE
jgi:hypothetical protein